jgi:segregation and condensation protein B
MPLQLAAVLEGLLFVAEQPITIQELARVTRQPARDVRAALEELKAAWQERGILLQEQHGAFLLVSHPDVAPYVRELLGVHRSERLSRATLETLAVIAYYQPVTRAEIERMRGVNSDHTLAVLLGRELVAAGERRPTPGRPIEYCTTFEFLKYFGLASLADLPERERFLAELATAGEDKAAGALIGREA